MGNDEVRIKIKIDANTQELVLMKNQVQDVGKGFNKTDSLASSFTNRILALGGAYLTLDAAINAGKMFVTQADSMKLLDARLKLATSSTAEYESQQKELLKTSLDTYTPLSNITTLFTRLNPALTKVGGNTLQVNQVVSSFTKGLQLGGSTVEETNSAILQFSQAMGSGALRGEEFNAMADASPKLLEYIAKGLGVASTELRNMAENGELTSLKVSNALLKVKSDIDRDFATLPLTVSKAVTNASTELAIGIKDIDYAIGITDTLAKSIERTTLNIGSYTQSVIGYYQEVKKFFDDNKMLTETMSKTFDFLSKAGNTTLTIATLDTLNNTFKSTKLGADEIIKKIDELEQRKASLAQNKWTDQNTQAINAQITDLRSQLGLLNKDMFFTSKDVIPQNKTAIDELIGEYDGYVKKVETINGTIVRNETEVTKLLGNEREKSLQQIEDSIKKAKLQGATEKEINDYRIRELQKLDDKQTKVNDDATNKANQLNKAYLDIAQIGLSAYDKALISNTQQIEGWKKQKVDAITLLQAEKKLNDELNVKTAVATAKEDLSYYERKVQLQNDSLEKELELANISYTQKKLDISGNENIEPQRKQELIALEKELLEITIERIKAEDNIKDIDSMLERQTSMLDTQLELIDATYEWGNSFDGVFEKVGNLSTSFAKMYKSTLISQKEQLKLDSKLSKAKERYGKNSIEYVEEENQYIMDSSKLKMQDGLTSLDNLTNIAASSKQMFAEQTAAYKTLNAIEAVGHAARMTAMIAEMPLMYTKLTVAFQTALAGQGSVPIIGFALVAGMAALLSSFGIGGSGGDGGSGGSSSPYSLGEMSMAKITELNDQGVVDRLDQQIALLEAIEKNGSAQKLSVDLAKAEFTQAKNEWVQDVFDISRVGWVPGGFSYGPQKQMEEFANISKTYSDMGLLNPFEFRTGTAGEWDRGGVRLNTELLRENPNELIKIIAEISKLNGLYGGPFGQAAGKELGFSDEAHSAFLAQIQSTFVELQGYVNDWAISVVDSVSELKSSADDLRDSYDSITGTTYYADIKLKNAFKDFNSLLKEGENYSSYIKDTITKIDESSKFIYEFSGILDENGKELSNYELLLSKNVDLIDEQIAKVDEFGLRVGMTFENGIEEAINYADSIDLVSQALVTSRENIKSFEDSFKSDFTLANEMAKNIGLNSLATDLESLDSLFIYLKSDTLGLVDAELELLNANKSLIENYNSIISQLDNIISPKTLSLGGVKVEDVTLESATDFLDQLSAAKEEEINRATTAMNAEKERLQKQKETAQEQKQAADTLKKAFETTTKSLNSTYKNIIGQTSLADSFNITQYQKLYNEIDAGITAGTDISDLTSDFNTYATSYASFIKDNAQTQQEYDRKMKVLANEVKGLAGKAETASLNDLDNRLRDANNYLISIDSSISSLDGNLQSKIDSINATYITQTQLLRDALEYSFTGKVSNEDTTLAAVVEANNYSTLIEDAFNTVLGRGTLTQFDDMNYWLEQLNSNKVSTSDLYKAIANAAVGFDINGYLANTGDYSLKTITLLSDSVKNAQKYLADNISQTTTTQTTNYYTQNQNDKALDEVVKELQRLNIISAANAENTKKLLKTNKQTLITGLQGA